MIHADRLSKEFNSFEALRGLNMYVRPGEVYGFIGQNGAGKSTTMNILAGLSRPTAGQCFVKGRDIAGIRHPGELDIGYLPEDPRFHPWMTAHETLSYLAGGHRPDYVLKILSWTGLEKWAEHRVGGFSRGMKQRLGIGAALIRDSELVILDEPCSALDPEGRSAVLRLIDDLRNMGKTVLFSTHILDDVERVCDRVGMIAEGKMVLEKPLSELQQDNLRPIYDVTTRMAVDASLLTAVREIPGVVSMEITGESFSVCVTDRSLSTELMRHLADKSIQVEFFGERKLRLEDLFLQKVNDV